MENGVNMATYNYLYILDRSDPFHTSMVTKCLPNWIKVKIVLKNNDTKIVKVLSKLHINKVVTLPQSYSKSFTDQEILKDISHYVFKNWID